MKIAIWFETTSGPWGGGNQFLRALSDELSQMGHEISHTPIGDEHVVLVNAHNTGKGGVLSPRRVAGLKYLGKNYWYFSALPTRVSASARRRGPAIVHRVDGVARMVRGRPTKADQIQPAVNRLADHTVFQSNYCREVCSQYGLHATDHSVIHNGVDPRLFLANNTKRTANDPLRLISVSWSSNPRKGFAKFAQLSQVPRVELYFAGNWCETVGSANVKLLGPRSSAELAEIMQNMDAMVHASENETCSNAVLEALACGLPVLYLDSGGNRELAEPYGIPLSDDVRDDIALLREHYVHLRERALADRDRFLIPGVAERYIEAFASAVRARNALA